MMTRTPTPKQSGGFRFKLKGGFSLMRRGLKRAFARRELFIREAQGTKRIVFDKGVQIQLALIGVALLFWLGYATSSFVMGKNSTRIMQERLAETHNAYEQRIAAMHEEYEDLNLRLILAEKEFTRLAEELTRRHKHLTTLIGIQSPIGKTIKKRQKIDRKTINKKRKSKKQSELKPLRHHENVFFASRPVGSSYENFPALSALSIAPKDSAKPSPYASVITPSRNHLRIGNPHIDRVSKKMIALDREQRAILDHLDEYVTRRIEIYQHVFAATEAIKGDMFSERVALGTYGNLNLTLSSEGGVGGPLIAMRPPEKTARAKKEKIEPLMTINKAASAKIDMQARQQVNAIHRKLKELDLLDQAIAHMPLSRPMPVYYVTSAFGPRIDPFTREWAFHTGIDLAGPKQDHVQSTLPGRVSFAGRARGYGKMVEIEHEFGFKTRYGHLRKIFVKEGQAIRFKQTIGMMGNTGRSTGDHLHYEILLDDKAYNPWKFIEAGKYVFEAVE